MSKKILLILAFRVGAYYLKTREECSKQTLFNAEKKLRYKIASRDDKDVLESLTETKYPTLLEARAAAEKAGYRALTVQDISFHSRYVEPRD